MRLCLVALFLVAAEFTTADEPGHDSRLVVKPDAFRTLVNPDCSHCKDEARRRAGELRDDDRVLSWIRDTKGQYNGGTIPIRFFLNPYRVISDSYGVFVYDPDAGYARGFAPSYDFSFHGWRNGIMVMKHKNGTLYSCLTGAAFDGPDKGKQLAPVPTILSNWGYWLKHYPNSVAYHMYDKYQPVSVPTVPNEGSLASRSRLDVRLPANEPVLGVVDGSRARAFPLETVAKQRLIEDKLGGRSLIVIWEPTTATAVAYRPIAGAAPTARIALAHRRGETSPVVRNFIARAVT